MSGPVKIALSLIGVLLVSLVVIIVLIKMELTPEMVRETIIPIAEEHLQRKVEVGEIKIGLFSGVSLADVKVLQRDGSDEFVSAGLISLSYRLWPLLTGKVVIDDVRLVQPKIVVTRNPDGSFNFSDLLPQETSDVSAAGEIKVDEQKPPSSATDSSINLLVQKIAIEDGALLFIDQLTNVRSPYRYSLNQLGFLATQMTLDKPFPIKFSALLNGSQIDLAGQFDISKKSGDFDLRLAPLDLVQFAPYYRGSLPGALGSARLSVSIEALLEANRLSSKGKVSLDKIDLTLDQFPDGAFKQADLTVEYAIDYRVDQQILDISTLLVDLNGIAIGAEGAVQLAGEEPQFDVALLLNKFDLRKLSQGLPAGLATELKSYSLAGLVNGSIELAGQPSDGARLLKSAQIDLVNVKARVANSRAGISGSIQYAEQVAQADKLLLTYADQQAQLSFTAVDLLSDIIHGEFRIFADSLDLNSFSAESVAEGDSKDKTASTETATAKAADSKLPPVIRQQSDAEEIGPFDLPLELKGTLTVNQLLYKQLSMNNVHADLLLKDNHLVVSKLGSNIAGGELLAATDINLGVKGLSYSGQLNLSQSNLTSLVSGLFPQSKQSVSGQFQLRNNFSGRGTIPDNLLRQLQLKGALQVQGGKVVGSPLLEQVSSFLGSSELKVLSFNQFTGNYNLRNEVASLAADLDSSKLKLRPEGTVGLDGAMNLQLDTRLAPTLLNSLGANKNLKQVITDAEGWGVFPLKVKGSINQPQIGFDSKELQKLATQQATQSVTDQLLEKLGVENEEEKVPVQQMLDGTLKKLFGN